MNRKCAMALVMAVSTALANTALSADSKRPEAESKSVTKLQEVVVTASKRAERLLNAPLAVTAITPDQLENQGVVSVQTLTAAAPDLEVKTVSWVDNTLQLTIRGITNTDFTAPGNPAVATYIDGVYVGRGTGLNGDFYDLSRIEVLRGPQGTLYGRNSTGGNVNILTADPTQVFGASAEASYGNYGDVQTHGMVNLPVSSTLAIRFAFVTHRSNGFYNTDGTTVRNYGQADDYGGRLTTLWVPSSSFRWRLSVDDFESDGTPGMDFDTAPNGRPNDGLPIFNRPTASSPEPLLHIDNLMIRSRMDWQVADAWSLTYLAGYQNVGSKSQFATSPDVFDGLVTIPVRSESHELDLNFNRNGIHNILGATYFHQIVRGNDVFHFYNVNETFGAPFTTGAKTDAWGVFDQLTYGLTAKLDLIGGIRYSSEHQNEEPTEFVFCQPMGSLATAPLSSLLAFAGPGCSTVLQAAATGKWSNVSWKAGLQYKVSDSTSTYATVTTGFKSGGVNPGLEVAGHGSYLPENIINYEMGVKTRLLDDRVSINSDLFFENYKDMQVTQILGVVTITENAADSHIYGVENEFQWLLTDRDRLSGYANYLHATYMKYPGAVDALTGVVYPSLAGNYLPHAPEFSGRLQYSHEFPIYNGGTVTPLFEIYAQSKNYLREFESPYDRVGGYATEDFTLTYQDPNAQWKITGYMNNLSNRLVRNGSFIVVGRYFSDYDAPRTYGVRVSYQY